MLFGTSTTNLSQRTVSQPSMTSAVVQALEVSTPAAETLNAGVGRDAPSRWEDAAPWFLTIASTITMTAIAWFLVENILWFRQDAMRGAGVAHTTYGLHVYHLHLAMIKRSVGLFSGFALLFLGTAVVFYSMRSRSVVKLGVPNFSADANSASPGIIAMALGVLLLLGTIASKDEFPPYAGEPTASGAASSQTQPMVVVPFPGGSK